MLTSFRISSIVIIPMVVKNLTLDDLIALSLIVIGSLAFYEACTTFPYEDSIFPMIASGIMVGAALLWVLRSYLPKFMHTAIIEYEESDRTKELIDDEDERSNDSAEPNDTANCDRIVEDSLIMYKLISLTVGFVALSYVIGFVWATPIFIAVYGKFMRFSLSNYIVVALVSFIVVLGFAYFTTIPIDEGIWWGYSI